MHRALNHLDESLDMNNGAPGLWTTSHMPPAVARALLPSSIWSNYFKFSFVRHPLDWFVSAYRHNFRLGAPPIRAMLAGSYTSGLST